MWWLLPNNRKDRPVPQIRKQLSNFLVSGAHTFANDGQDMPVFFYFFDIYGQFFTIPTIFQFFESFLQFWMILPMTRRGRLCKVPKLKESAEVQKLRRQSFQMSGPKLWNSLPKNLRNVEKLWAWRVQRTAWLFPLKGAWWTKSRWVDTWTHWRDHWTGDQHPGVPEREEDGGLGHLRLWLWPRPQVTKIIGEVS